MAQPTGRDEAFIKERGEAFTKLARAQRGDPEVQMTRVQRASGGGVLNGVVEHTGDLTNRMADKYNLFTDGLGYDVDNKLRRVLGTLRSPYGFAKEHAENMRANAKYLGIPLSEHKANVDAELQEYAKDHAKLEVYNDPQRWARDAAVALGEQNWAAAVENLEKIEDLMKNEDAYRRAAGEYKGRFVDMRDQDKSAQPTDPADADADKMAQAADGDGQPPNAAKRQKAALAAATSGQWMDKIMRMPFAMLGYVENGKWKWGAEWIDSEGRWKLGKQLEKSVTKVLTEWKPEEASHMAFLKPYLHNLRSGLIDRYGLSKELLLVDDKRDATERRYLMKGVEMAQKILDSADTTEEFQSLHAAIVGEEMHEADWMKLPNEIRAAIAEITEEYIQLGLLDRKDAKRNQRTYLHRVYMKHEMGKRTSKVAAWANEWMARKRKGILGDSLKGRGMFFDVEKSKLEQFMPAGLKADVTKEGTRFRVFEEFKHGKQEAFDALNDGDPDPRQVIKRIFVKEGDPLPANLQNLEEDAGTWEVRGMKKGKVTIWRDYTKNERVEMGEILDARYTVTKTFMLAAKDISTGQYFYDIAQNDEWTRSKVQIEKDSETGDLKVIDSAETNRFWDDGVDWVRVAETKIPGTGKPKWGALSGKYVRPEIWRDIQELDIMHNNKGLWRSLLTMWKLNKTARSPVVHMNNVMSNLIFMDLADVRMRDLWGGIEAYVHKDENFKEADLHGTFGSTFIDAEIKGNVLDPILKKMANEAMRDIETIDKRAKMLGYMSDLHAAWKKVDDKMVGYYQMEDNIFRMAYYMRRRGLGDTPAEAARAAREGFLNYDIRAPYINAMRNSVLPFLSYTYRAAPLIASAIATRPWKLAKYSTIAYLINAFGYMMYEGDEDEERRSLREDEAGKTWIGAPRKIRMPFGSDGRPYMADVRRYIPAGDIFDVGQGSSAFPYPAPFQLGGPLQLAFEIMVFNKSAFTGQEVTEEIDTTSEKFAKSAKHAYKSWMPSAAWIPGSWYWDKIVRAAKGQTDEIGRDYDLTSAFLSSIGVKLQPLDIAKNQRNQTYEFRKIERAIKYKLKELDRKLSRKGISQAVYNRDQKNLLEKLDRLADKRNKAFGGSGEDK